MSNIQYVDKNNAGSKGTKFILPKFTDDGICTITDYEVSSSNIAVSNPGNGFVSTPTDFTQDIIY